ncbi:hypothetical protein LIER_34785 [Lithospermum erythrorhizon]|uniref:Uncharacterized protein n=1 Tax=Lithospermum erythrorhizon TaxID=34254 RepID=A0AAV3S3Q6_LITER
MISQRGIAPNPDKMVVVQAMQSPHMQKELLAQLVASDVLQFYLAVSELALSSILKREEKKVQIADEYQRMHPRDSRRGPRVIQLSRSRRAVGLVVVCGRGKQPGRRRGWWSWVCSISSLPARRLSLSFSVESLLACELSSLALIAPIWRTLQHTSPERWCAHRPRFLCDGAGYLPPEPSPESSVHPPIDRPGRRTR